MSIFTAQDIDVITDQISPSRQGWHRDVTVKSGLDGATHKIRVRIYRDSYDFQSRIGVDVWVPATLSWSNVKTEHGEDHKDLPSAYSGLGDPKRERAARSAIFAGTAELVNELIAYAQEVLA